MHVEIKVDGDIDTENDRLRAFFHADELFWAVRNANELIEERLIREEVASNEQKFLRKLISILFIDGLDG